MWSYQHPDLVALDLIEDLLGAYGESRFSPSRPQLARIRRAVLAETAAVVRAWSLVEPGAAERRRLGLSLPSFALPRLRIPALGVASLAAAIMGAAMGTAVLAAPPGSPFYPTRVALEQAFMPPLADLDERLASRNGHLEDRLAEAQAAASRGDVVALEAALAAYDAEVADVVAELGADDVTEVDVTEVGVADVAEVDADSERLATTEAALSRHVTVLTALESRVPEQASIENALKNSQKAIDKIKEKAKEKAGKPA